MYIKIEEYFKYLNDKFYWLLTVINLSIDNNKFKFQISALFCDPFIYQNCVYLFNRFESTILSVAITGKNRGRTEILNTRPDARFQKPNNKYANRCLILLRNIILVYCHQRLDKPNEEPQLWILELKYAFLGLRIKLIHFKRWEIIVSEKNILKDIKN